MGAKKKENGIKYPQKTCLFEVYEKGENNFFFPRKSGISGMSNKGHAAESREMVCEMQ